MDTLLDNYYVTFLLIIILFCVIYYYVIICTSTKSKKKVVEHYYSKCCPPKYPDLVYDWKYIPTCYNKKNDLGVDPLPNCLPPNFLKRPFNNAQKPRNYIF